MHLMSANGDNRYKDISSFNYEYMCVCVFYSFSLYVYNYKQLYIYTIWLLNIAMENHHVLKVNHL